MPLPLDTHSIPLKETLLISSALLTSLSANIPKVSLPKDTFKSFPPRSTSETVDRSGTFGSQPMTEMEAYDMLSPEVRCAVACANINWQSEQFLADYSIPQHVVVRHLRELDHFLSGRPPCNSYNNSHLRSTR